MNYARFRVIGINPNTGRNNTKHYEKQTEEAARLQAIADGLIEPITVDVENHISIPDWLTENALAIDAVIPDGACKEDISAIVARIRNDDEVAPDPGLSRYAHSCGVLFSRFAGREAFLGYLVEQLKDANLAATHGL